MWGLELGLGLGGEGGDGESGGEGESERWVVVMVFLLGPYFPESN
jgi:hypothetical protein